MNNGDISILLVDDDEEDILLARNVLREALDGSALELDTAQTFAQGLQQVEKSRYDLLLFDYQLGDRNGLDLMRDVRARGIETPVVFLTGRGDEEVAVETMKLGATDYVVKDHLARLGSAVLAALQGPRKIAYFSMEIALGPHIPTYSGGLGILAGDTIRSAADLHVPMVAVSLLYRAGYFIQQIDASGWQRETPVSWDVGAHLHEMQQRATIQIEGRPVVIRAWRHVVHGCGNYVVPVYLLDTDLPENAEWDRGITGALYGGDWYLRLCQEILLGVGGVEMLRALGHKQIERFHMNEGHASFLVPALLEEEARKAGRAQINVSDIAAVRQKCIFTTHTPVPSGHDQFPLDAVGRALGCKNGFFDLFSPGIAPRVIGPPQYGATAAAAQPATALNMTYLALNMSRYVNGVAKKHGEVSRLMFAGYQIDAITNGVHVETWACPAVQALYDKYLADWRRDNFSLRYAESIPSSELWEAHMSAKRELLEHVRADCQADLDPAAFTIGFARRITPYKRPDLLFIDLERLRRIVRECGKIQVLCAGKAHPREHEGKLIIQQIFKIRELLRDDLPIIFIPNYDLSVAKLLTSGVDLWLNTPQPPLEASGTSGMKAALNGIPSLSVLDGWWIEGHIEGVTGWSIGEKAPGVGSLAERQRDASSLYEKLEQVILPMFYHDRERFIAVMRHAIAINGSFFNTQRMLQQYVLHAYY